MPRRNDTSYVLCRARYLLPFAEPDRAQRIEDGYVLAKGETILEAGPYAEEIGRRILENFGSELKIIGDPGESGGVPKLNAALLPAFVKAHGHDHEQPLIGIAKDEPLTSWLDHAVNPFTSFMRSQREELTELLGCVPQLAVYRMARLVDIYYGITASMVHHCNFNKYKLCLLN